MSNTRKFIEAHGVRTRVAARSGFIDVEAVFIADGRWYHEWETIRESRDAARVWLGY